MITLFNPENGADIGVTDENGIGQLILSDRQAYTHLKGETKDYEDKIGQEILALYPFLIDADKGKEKTKYEKIELNGQSYYLDPITRKVFPKEEIDKEAVTEAIILKGVKDKATPAIPKQAYKVKVDKQAIKRNNTLNTLKSFQDHGVSDYKFAGEGLTAE